MDPQMLMQLLQHAQSAQGGGPPPGGPPMDQGPQESADTGGDWLATAINAVHGGMVQESDPKLVSLLGNILNQLTTYQQHSMAPQGAQQ